MNNDIFVNNFALVLVVVIMAQFTAFAIFGTAIFLYRLLNGKYPKE